MTHHDAPVRARDNFDALRIGAASMVLVSHQRPLMGLDEWVVTGFQSVGGIGLLVFFTMSGYLVCDSWQRDPHLVRFAVRRLLRIWPALAVVVVLSACVLGPLMTSRSLGDYVGDPAFLHYFGILRFAEAERLPGVFESNAHHAVNGSLWTLPIEVRWYAYLAVAGVLGVVRWRWLLLATTIGIAIHYFVVFDVERVIASGGKRGWKEELGLYFLAGACLQRYRSAWIDRRARLLVAAVAGAAVLAAAGEHHAAYWIVLSTATLSIAVTGGPLQVIGRYGDFSYGVYLYAFPVQQTVVALTHGELPFATGLLLSAVCTLLCAVASWHLVEAPALRLKPSRRSTFGSLRWFAAALPFGRRAGR